MKKALFVDCCIRREESRTKRLAYSFLARLSPDYGVQRLTLMEEGLQPLMGDFFAARQSLLAAGKLEHPRFRYARQFADVDLVVIAAPFWDLNFMTPVASSKIARLSSGLAFMICSTLPCPIIE